MDRVKIDILPQKLLFDILFKLPNSELCLMRRTCSLINNLAEGWRKLLSSRCSLGLYLQIYYTYEKTALCCWKHKPGYPVYLYSNDIQESLSAISINQIHIMAPITSYEIVDFVKKFSDRPVISVDAQDLPEEYVIELVDILNCHEMIAMAHPFTTILKEAKNTQKLNLCGSLEFFEKDHDIYETVKCFGRINLTEFDDQSFNKILWEIYYFPSHEINCSIFCFWYKKETEKLISPMPLMDILWDINDIPTEQTNIDTPLLIRKMNLGQKCAIISSEFHKTKPRPHESIHITDNNIIAILEKIKECLFIRNGNRALHEKYLTSEEATIQRSLLCDIYMSAEKFKPVWFDL